jgi:hypothetical protein
MSHPTSVANGPTRRDVALAAVAGFAVVASCMAIIWTMRIPGQDPLQTMISVYDALMFTFVGVVVLWKRRGHGIGRLAITIGLLFSASLALTTVLEWWQPSIGVRSVLLGPVKALYDMAEALSTVLAAAGLLFGAVLLITWFPDGRRTSRLGAVVEVALVAGVVTIVVASLREPIFLQVGWSRVLDDVLTLAGSVAIVAFAGAWFGAIVDLALRYRGADPVRQTQMRWVLVAAAVSASLLVSLLVLGEFVPVLWSIALASLGLPVFAVAIAITRYHLYDIDRIVSQSISYVLVTALLLSVFGGLILILQSLVSGVVASPGSTLDPRVVAASTLVVAALFNPVRMRVQAAVDRRFHRARYDAERTVAGFAGRLRDELDLGTLTGELRRTTTDAVEPTATAVWLRVPDDARLRPHESSG